MTFFEHFCFSTRFVSAVNFKLCNRNDDNIITVNFLMELETIGNGVVSLKYEIEISLQKIKYRYIYDCLVGIKAVRTVPQLSYIYKHIMRSLNCSTILQILCIYCLVLSRIYCCKKEVVSLSIT